MNFNKISIVLLLTLITTTSYASNSMMSADFGSMNSCLKGIQKSSGQSLRIVTDTPTKVSGLLSNGNGFACEKKNSGSRGTYYTGWYFN